MSRTYTKLESIPYFQIIFTFCAYNPHALKSYDQLAVKPTGNVCPQGLIQTDVQPKLMQFFIREVLL